MKIPLKVALIFSIHWIPPEHFNDYSHAAKSTASDVFAFGTTIWEIFSYGVKPLSTLSPKEVCNLEIVELFFKCC